MSDFITGIHDNFRSQTGQVCISRGNNNFDFDFVLYVDLSISKLMLSIYIVVYFNSR